MTVVDRPPSGPDAGRGASTTGEPPGAGGAIAGRRRTTPAEDLVFLACGLWALVGLCLDGWAHRHQPELESFFTPWHAVFYSGFTAGAGWLALVVVRGRARAHSLWAAVPEGYQLAVVGLGLFALGGVGDMVWHTAFGVETSIDALLSPTHLVLLVGMLGGITAPLRAAWRDATGPVAPPFVRFLAPLGSLTITATAVAFFFLYANGLNNWPMTEPLVVGSGQSEAFAALGVLSTIVTGLVLVAPLLVMLQRWVPPIGAATVLCTVVGLFMAGLDAFENWWQVLPAVAAGVTADITIGALLRRPGPAPTAGLPGDRARWAARACGLVVPLVVGAGTTAAVRLWWAVRWPPELWVGATAMAMLAGLTLALLTHPSPAGGHARHHS